MTFHAQIHRLDKAHFKVSNMRRIIKWAKGKLFVPAVDDLMYFGDFKDFEIFEIFEYDCIAGEFSSFLEDVNNLINNSSIMHLGDYEIGFAILKDPSQDHLFVEVDICGHIKNEDDWLYSKDVLIYPDGEPENHNSYFYTHIGVVDESKLDDAFSQTLLLSKIKGSSEFLAAVSQCRLAKSKTRKFVTGM